MNINKAYKTELDVNNKQAAYFAGCAGYSRFVYNWALDYWIKEHERGEKRTGWMKLNTLLTKEKRDQYQWMYQYPDWIRVYAVKSCDFAYQNFFRRVKQNKTPGFPHFKSRKRSPNKFTINGQGIKITETAVRLPLVGWIRLKEHGYIPVNPKKIISATLSERCGHWYISVDTEEIIDEKIPGDHIIGVDLGIKTLAVTSDGIYYENPKALYKAEKKLKRLDRRLSRKENGSKNREKAKILRARAYEKVARIRKHVLNQITTELAKTKSVIVIEDLNVSGMMKNHHLARAISDVGFSEFRRMLEYKCSWYGSELIVTDRFYPSSKTCSNCGVIHDMPLNQRTFQCECGLKIDRDENAAINLKNRAKHARIDACGETISPQNIGAVSLKQEASSGCCA